MLLFNCCGNKLLTWCMAMDDPWPGFAEDDAAPLPGSYPAVVTIVRAGQCFMIGT
jgi:hypothetical protein